MVFVGRDSNRSRPGIANGIYSIPAAGGPITKLVDYQTQDPTGGTFSTVGCCTGANGFFSFDGKTVAFVGANTGGKDGVYTVNMDGSSLTMVADVDHPFDPSPPPGLLQRVIHFSSPAISGSNVFVVGGTGLDPSNGYNGLYLGSIGGNGKVNEQLTSRQQLPGNNNGNFHTRFVSHALAMDGNLLAFVADDSNSYTSSGHYYGLYTTNLGSHSINKIADVNSSLAGLGPVGGIAPGGVSVSQGNVLFLAGDTTGHRALYLWKDGSTTKIIGHGDTLDGGSDFSVMLDAGTGALYGSSFAFRPWGAALYLALSPDDARLAPTPTAPPTATAAATPSAPIDQPPDMPADDEPADGGE